MKTDFQNVFNILHKVASDFEKEKLSHTACSDNDDKILKHFLKKEKDERKYLHDYSTWNGLLSFTNKSNGLKKDYEFLSSAGVDSEFINKFYDTALKVNDYLDKTSAMLNNSRVNSITSLADFFSVKPVDFVKKDSSAFIYKSMFPKQFYFDFFQTVPLELSVWSEIFDSVFSKDFKGIMLKLYPPIMHFIIKRIDFYGKKIPDSNTIISFLNDSINYNIELSRNIYGEDSIFYKKSNNDVRVNDIRLEDITYLSRSFF